jgi:hypothetical protein
MNAKITAILAIVRAGSNAKAAGTAFFVVRFVMTMDVSKCFCINETVLTIGLSVLRFPAD